uniref:Uncharacterized protein n=1 Tax=Oryza meridionalis TaxID=40149 RepID=A0A0E0EAQ6_9ORYZ
MAVVGPNPCEAYHWHEKDSVVVCTWRRRRHGTSKDGVVCSRTRGRHCGACAARGIGSGATVTGYGVPVMGPSAGVVWGGGTARGAAMTRPSRPGVPMEWRATLGRPTGLAMVGQGGWHGHSKRPTCPVPTDDRCE